MPLFDRMTADGCEQVVFCEDSRSGLRSIIAVHDTTLGPSLGGVRMRPYRSDDEALNDCLRLARGMTQKAAVAGVSLGGGKSVIIGDPRTDKTEALLRAHGRFIQTLNGRYIPGVDAGTGPADLEVIGREAQRVSCVRVDPSPLTALGVFEGIRAAVRTRLGADTVQGLSVCVQGAGHVGSVLAGLLSSAGAKVSVCDVDAARAQEVAERVEVTEIPHEAATTGEWDVLAPCAYGAVVNDETVSSFRCAVIAGGANNVLAEPRHGDQLRDRGILYAPDYCINAGGLIALEEEILGHDIERTERRVRTVFQLLLDVFTRAEADGVAPHSAAEALARERLAALSALRPRYVAPAAKAV